MTTPPVDYYPPATSPQYPDRRPWLIAFGVLQLLIALAALGMIGLMFLSMLLANRVPNQPAMPWRILLQAVVTYGIACVFFVVMGIGSIQARRWARSLMLAISWLWLIGGALGTLIYAFVLPKTLSHAGQMPHAVVIAVVVVMLLFFSLILVALPLAMLIFYRLPSVKATCDRRDPVTRWTDCIPIPVLVLFVMLATGTASYFVMAFTMPMVAVFGKFVMGWAARFLCLLLCAWWAYLAWGTYRLRLSSWWATILSLSIISLSSAITFMKGDATKMYASMGMPSAQSALSAQLLRSPVFVLLMVGSCLVFIAFLLFLRKYFVGSGLPSRN
jgi:MFS family permease